jgi:hypothetical protein
MLGDAIAGIVALLEHSGLGRAARGAAWLYPLVNMLHVLGAGLLVGAIVTFDIQILRRLSGAGTVLRAAFPVAVAGLLLQVASGVVLLSADASSVVRNPAFQFKMAVLTLGLINLVVFHRRFGEALKVGAPLKGAYGFAAVSFVSWVLVLLAGRAIAYL